MQRHWKIEVFGDACFCAACVGIGSTVGIEIKAPQPIAAVTYALDGGLPDKYRMQVQGSMFVTGFAQWAFFCFHKALPSFAITVQRDERLMLTIAQALSEFYERFNEAFDKLNKLADEPRINPFNP